MAQQDSLRLPKSWIETKLSSISNDVSYGYTASSSIENVGPHLLRITDIQNNKVDWKSVPYCEIEEIKIPKYQVGKGDLLFARTGATVGKSYLVNDEIPHSVYASYLIRVRCLDGFNIKYMAHFFNSPNYWNQITEFSSGIGQPSVNGTKLKELRIPISPLPEQKRIVEKLDSLLAQVESIQQRLNNLPNIIKRFRQSVLAAAVSGKLTEQWRGNSEYILKNGMHVPVLWSVKSSLDVCDKVQSGSTPRNNPFDQNGTIPFLKVYNIVNQKINFDYKPQFITEEIHSTKIKRSIALPGDILMNIVGPPLGKVAILTNQFPEWNLNQAITFFRANEDILNKKYLYFVLCEGALVRKVMPDTKGSVGQINISLSQCREALIPLPSVDEQTEIVTLVEQYFALVDTLEKNLTNAKKRVDNLTQSILAKAFRGELVPQDPFDEPAEQLLARIKIARTEAEKLEKAAKKAAKASKVAKTKK